MSSVKNAFFTEVLGDVTTAHEEAIDGVGVVSDSGGGNGVVEELDVASGVGS